MSDQRRDRRDANRGISTVKIKQVILIRRDLAMRRGKEIAQGAHASMEFLVAHLQGLAVPGVVTIEIDAALCAWLRAGTPKICLQVKSANELLDRHEQALARNLRSHLIEDSGRTEFAGVPTITACAIGPDLAEDIDAVTGDLLIY